MADALDLGSSAFGVGVRLPSSAPIMRKWLNGRAPPCQGGCCGFESRLSLQICGYRISVILQPSKLERWVRFPLPAPYGERSSVGRAPVCGTGCRGFESHRSPHLGISPSGKAPHFDCGIRRFESCYPCHIFGLLAQSVEHLTFNQGVRGSIPR